MAKQKKPQAGDYCRNKASGRIHKVTRVSPVHGWFKLDASSGWTPWCDFTPVPKETAEEELRGKKKKEKG